MTDELKSKELISIRFMAHKSLYRFYFVNGKWDMSEKYFEDKFWSNCGGFIP